MLKIFFFHIYFLFGYVIKKIKFCITLFQRCEIYADAYDMNGHTYICIPILYIHIHVYICNMYVTVNINPTLKFYSETMTCFRILSSFATQLLSACAQLTYINIYVHKFTFTEKHGQPEAKFYVFVLYAQSQCCCV